MNILTSITCIPDAITGADECFSKLWNELSWVRHDKVPRREYYCNEIAKPYTYGTLPYARTYEPQEWHPTIMLLQKVAKFYAGCNFEVCFLNGYENQSDQLGWHADNSPEMDDARPIAIISLGVEREIMFRDNERTNTERLRLGHGSLCLMHAGMQDTHQHRIPASFMCGERVSLTFRGYVQ